MVVACGIRQARVEVERFGGVVPERAHGVGQRNNRVATDRLTDRMPIDRGLGREPRSVGGQIDRERDQPQRIPAGKHVTPHCPQPRSLHLVLTSRRHVERQRHRAEEQHEVHAGPLGGASQSQQHPGAEPPPAHTHPRSPHGGGAAAGQQSDVHPFANLIAVDDERAERRDDEERQEAVQQRGPRGDEADPVADQQHPGDGADQCRPADPPHDPHHQRHQDHTQQGAGEPPAESVVTEDGLPDRDQLLTDRRVNHQAVPGVVFHPMVVQHLPGLGCVMLLVEDGGAGIGQRAQVQEPGHRGQQRDQAGHDPAA